MPFSSPPLETDTIHFLLYQLVYGYGVEKCPIANFTRFVPSYTNGIDILAARRFLAKTPPEQASDIVRRFAPNSVLNTVRKIAVWFGTAPVQQILRFLKRFVQRNPSVKTKENKMFEYIAEKKMHMNYMDDGTKKPATKYIPYYTDKIGTKHYLPFTQDVSDPQYYLYTSGYSPLVESINKLNHYSRYLIKTTSTNNSYLLSGARHATLTKDTREDILPVFNREMETTDNGNPRVYLIIPYLGSSKKDETNTLFAQVHDLCNQLYGCGGGYTRPYSIWMYGRGQREQPWMSDRFKTEMTKVYSIFKRAIHAGVLDKTLRVLDDGTLQWLTVGRRALLTMERTGGDFAAGQTRDRAITTWYDKNIRQKIDTTQFNKFYKTPPKNQDEVEQRINQLYTMLNSIYRFNDWNKSSETHEEGVYQLLLFDGYNADVPNDAWWYNRFTEDIINYRYDAAIAIARLRHAKHARGRNYVAENGVLIHLPPYNKVRTLQNSQSANKYDMLLQQYLFRPESKRDIWKEIRQQIQYEHTEAYGVRLRKFQDLKTNPEESAIDYLKRLNAEVMDVHDCTALQKESPTQTLHCTNIAEDKTSLGYTQYSLELKGSDRVPPALMVKHMDTGNIYTVKRVDKTKSTYINTSKWKEEGIQTDHTFKTIVQQHQKAWNKTKIWKVLTSAGLESTDPGNVHHVWKLERESKHDSIVRYSEKRLGTREVNFFSNAPEDWERLPKSVRYKFPTPDDTEHPLHGEVLKKQKELFTPPGRQFTQFMQRWKATSKNKEEDKEQYEQCSQCMWAIAFYMYMHTNGKTTTKREVPALNTVNFTLIERMKRITMLQRKTFIEIIGIFKDIIMKITHGATPFALIKKYGTPATNGLDYIVKYLERLVEDRGYYIDQWYSVKDRGIHLYKRGGQQNLTEMVFEKDALCVCCLLQNKEEASHVVKTTHKIDTVKSRDLHDILEHMTKLDKYTIEENIRYGRDTFLPVGSVQPRCHVSEKKETIINPVVPIEFGVADVVKHNEKDFLVLLDIRQLKTSCATKSTNNTTLLEQRMLPEGGIKIKYKQACLYREHDLWLRIPQSRLIDWRQENKITVTLWCEIMKTDDDMVYANPLYIGDRNPAVISDTEDNIITRGKRGEIEIKVVNLTGENAPQYIATDMKKNLESDGYNTRVLLPIPYEALVVDHSTCVRCRVAKHTMGNISIQPRIKQYKRRDGSWEETPSSKCILQRKTKRDNEPWACGFNRLYRMMEQSLEEEYNPSTILKNDEEILLNAGPFMANMAAEKDVGWKADAHLFKRFRVKYEENEENTGIFSLTALSKHEEATLCWLVVHSTEVSNMKEDKLNNVAKTLYKTRYDPHFEDEVMVIQRNDFESMGKCDERFKQLVVYEVQRGVPDDNANREYVSPPMPQPSEWMIVTKKPVTITGGNIQKYSSKCERHCMCPLATELPFATEVNNVGAEHIFVPYKSSTPSTIGRKKLKKDDYAFQYYSGQGTYFPPHVEGYVKSTFSEAYNAVDNKHLLRSTKQNKILSGIQQYEQKLDPLLKAFYGPLYHARKICLHCKDGTPWNKQAKKDLQQLRASLERSKETDPQRYLSAIPVQYDYTKAFVRYYVETHLELPTNTGGTADTSVEWNTQDTYYLDYMVFLHYLLLQTHLTTCNEQQRYEWLHYGRTMNWSFLWVETSKLLHYMFRDWTPDGDRDISKVMDARLFVESVQDSTTLANAKSSISTLIRWYVFGSMYDTGRYAWRNLPSWPSRHSQWINVLNVVLFPFDQRILCFDKYQNVHDKYDDQADKSKDYYRTSKNKQINWTEFWVEILTSRQGAQNYTTKHIIREYKFRGTIYRQETKQHGSMTNNSLQYFWVQDIQYTSGCKREEVHYIDEEDKPVDKTAEVDTMEDAEDAEEEDEEETSPDICNENDDIYAHDPEYRWNPDIVCTDKGTMGEWEFKEGGWGEEEEKEVPEPHKIPYKWYDENYVYDEETRDFRRITGDDRRRTPLLRQILPTDTPTSAQTIEPYVRAFVAWLYKPGYEMLDNFSFEQIFISRSGANVNDDNSTGDFQPTNRGGFAYRSSMTTTDDMAASRINKRTHQLFPIWAYICNTVAERRRPNKKDRVMTVQPSTYQYDTPRITGVFSEERDDAFVRVYYIDSVPGRMAQDSRYYNRRSFKLVEIVNEIDGFYVGRIEFDVQHTSCTLCNKPSCWGCAMYDPKHTSYDLKASRCYRCQEKTCRGCIQNAITTKDYVRETFEIHTKECYQGRNNWRGELEGNNNTVPYLKYQKLCVMLSKRLPYNNEYGWEENFTHSQNHNMMETRGAAGMCTRCDSLYVYGKGCNHYNQKCPQKVEGGTNKQQPVELPYKEDLTDPWKKLISQDGHRTDRLCIHTCRICMEQLEPRTSLLETDYKTLHRGRSMAYYNVKRDRKMINSAYTNYTKDSHAYITNPTIDTERYKATIISVQKSANDQLTVKCTVHGQIHPLLSDGIFVVAPIQKDSQDDKNATPTITDIEGKGFPYCSRVPVYDVLSIKRTEEGGNTLSLRVCYPSRRGRSGEIAIDEKEVLAQENIMFNTLTKNINQNVSIRKIHILIGERVPQGFDQQAIASVDNSRFTKWFKTYYCNHIGIQESFAILSGLVDEYYYPKTDSTSVPTGHRSSPYDVDLGTYPLCTECHGRGKYRRHNVYTVQNQTETIVCPEDPKYSKERNIISRTSFLDGEYSQSPYVRDSKDTEKPLNDELVSERHGRGNGDERFKQFHYNIACYSFAGVVRADSAILRILPDWAVHPRSEQNTRERWVDKDGNPRTFGIDEYCANLYKDDWNQDEWWRSRWGLYTHNAYQDTGGVWRTDDGFGHSLTNPMLVEEGGETTTYGTMGGSLPDYFSDEDYLTMLFDIDTLTKYNQGEDPKMYNKKGVEPIQNIEMHVTDTEIRNIHEKGVNPLFSNTTDPRITGVEQQIEGTAPYYSLCKSWDEIWEVTATHFNTSIGQELGHPFLKYYSGRLEAEPLAFSPVQEYLSTDKYIEDKTEAYNGEPIYIYDESNKTRHYIGSTKEHREQENEQNYQTNKHFSIRYTYLSMMLLEYTIHGSCKVLEKEDYGLLDERQTKGFVPTINIQKGQFEKELNNKIERQRKKQRKDIDHYKTKQVFDIADYETRIETDKCAQSLWRLIMLKENTEFKGDLEPLIRGNLDGTREAIKFINSLKTKWATWWDNRYKQGADTIVPQSQDTQFLYLRAKRPEIYKIFATL